MYKKSYILLFVVLALLMSVLPAVHAQDDVFSVAVVAPSAINDLAFSQSMYDALVAIQEEMGEEAFQFDFQEGTFVVDDAAVALRDWASSGEYDLIIAHGSQYGSIVEELAPEFPEVSFAWGTDVNTFGLDNVYAYTAAAEEGGFINGAVAAMMTESKNIGVVGPIEVGDAKAYVDGFKAGVAATDPEVTVNINYIGSFSDVPLATAAAETLIDNGADILTGSAQMVVGPIAVAQEKDALWFGTQASQAELAAEVGVVFQVYKWDVILTEIIDNIEAGTLGGEAYTLTLENGGLAMEISDLRADITEDDIATLQETIDSYSEQISSGDIVVLPEVAEEPEPEATP
jgi:basic membrane lipoprotein Med (substrate-binding protein (PBP1-ABC) superfamily)